MKDRFKFRIAVYERQQNNMPWAFVEYIDPDNQHWGLNQCGDIISDSFYSAHYTRKNAPDSVHRVYEPEMSTGLKDKNGNLIYESDYVKANDIIYRVFWDKTKISLVNILNGDIIDISETITMEIVGNEHEKDNISEIPKNPKRSSD